MGLKDLFSSKKLIDKIYKYFQEAGITLQKGSDKYSYELFLSESGYSLYPYFKLREADGALSYIVNVRKLAEGDLPYAAINSFNLRSEYLKAMIRDDSLYLEYNTIISYETVREILMKLTESIFSLQEDIDKL